MLEQRSTEEIAKRAEEASLGSEVLKQGTRVEIEVEKDGKEDGKEEEAPGETSDGEG